MYIVLRWSLIPSYNRQNAFVNFSLNGAGSDSCSEVDLDPL